LLDAPTANTAGAAAINAAVESAMTASFIFSSFEVQRINGPIDGSFHERLFITLRRAIFLLQA
jgi:hypothetical protein